MTRFDDGGRYLAEFSNRIDVHCPRCRSRATVTRHGEVGPARIACVSCPYAAGFAETGWLGPMRGSVRRRCGMCGQWVERRFQGPRPPRIAQCVCDCGWQFEEEVSLVRLQSDLTDPFFGLDLWFTAEFRGETVWAYNAEHLRFLKEYISADLRERVPNRNSSLTSRLPAWLKSAKNRPSLVTVIEHMEDRELHK